MARVGGVNANSAEEVAALLNRGAIDERTAAQLQIEIAGGNPNDLVQGQSSDVFQKLAEIINRFRSGDLRGASLQTVLDTIKREITRGDYEAARALYNPIRADLVRIMEGTSPERGFQPTQVTQINAVPTAEVQRFDQPTGPFSPNIPLTQQELFPFQTQADQARRLRENAFGRDLTPVANRAVNSILNTFFGQQPITNAARGLNIEDAFSAFRGNRPDAARLTQGLQNIQSGGVATPGFQFRFNPGGVPQPAEAFSASIQPLLSGLNPVVGNNFGGFLQDEFLDRLAQNHQNFLTTQQVLNLLSPFQGFA